MKGPHFKELVHVLEIALKKADIDPGYVANIKSYLEDGNFVNCKKVVFEIPIGEWPLDPSKFWRNRND
jgi:hypothetical protein